MTSYQFPEDRRRSATAPPRTVYIVASGDLRPSANVKCWPVQQQLEADVTRAVESFGWTVVRGHAFDEVAGHGFIDSQRKGLDVFATLPPDAPLLVVEAVWQYSHHVLAGLRTHRGPIMVVANWNGTFPGPRRPAQPDGQPDQGRCRVLVVVECRLHRRVGARRSAHVAGHRDSWSTTSAMCTTCRALDAGVDEVALGRALADQLRREKAIIGVFDEGCMGMYNAIFDDELLNPLGIYKERLSQSALVAEMNRVGDDEAAAVKAWLDDAGLRFDFGTDEENELTPAQVTSQLKMYIAALRIADDFGLDAVGIQYQQDSRMSSRRAISPRGCSTTSSGHRCAAATGHGVVRR